MFIMPEFLQTYLFACVKIYIIRVLGFLLLYEEYLFFQLVFYIKRTQDLKFWYQNHIYVYIFASFSIATY